MMNVNFRDEAKKMQERMTKTMDRARETTRKHWEKVSNRIDIAGLKNRFGRQALTNRANGWRTQVESKISKVETRISEDFYRLLDRVGLATKEDVQSIEAKMLKLASKLNVSWQEDQPVVAEPAAVEAGPDKKSKRKAKV